MGSQSFFSLLLEQFSGDGTTNNLSAVAAADLSAVALITDWCISERVIYGESWVSRYVIGCFRQKQFIFSFSSHYLQKYKDLELECSNLTSQVNELKAQLVQHQVIFQYLQKVEFFILAIIYRQVLRSLKLFGPYFLNFFKNATDLYLSSRFSLKNYFSWLHDLNFNYRLLVGLAVVCTS